MKIKKRITAMFEPEYDPNVFRTIFNLNEDNGRVSKALFKALFPLNIEQCILVYLFCEFFFFFYKNLLKI